MFNLRKTILEIFNFGRKKPKKEQSCLSKKVPAKKPSSRTFAQKSKPVNPSSKALPLPTPSKKKPVKVKPKEKNNG